MNAYDLIVLGGGAAGIFTAINCAKRFSDNKILLLERSNQLLSKVRISGGGRCNVTHACFDPKQLAANYPRGNKALIGPFNRFQPQDTIEWFKKHGVKLKTEEDGRMFPTTDNSQTIIDCLLEQAMLHKVDIWKGQKIENLTKENDFIIKIKNAPSLMAKNLVLATGSNPAGLELAKSLGHTIIDPVPSLFTLNIPTSPLLDLAGISVPHIEIKLKGTKQAQSGPLLLTHWGFSGPAALRLSAWEARTLHEKDYKTEVVINWLPTLSLEKITNQLIQTKESSATQSLGRHNIFDLPKNLWKRLLEVAGIDAAKLLSQIPHKELRKLAEKLHADIYTIDGKTTNKSEFVTCGGIKLNEVDFKTMQSRKCPGLYFAGEILDIDGITGGFNFQNAWTTGWLASHLK